MDWGMKNRLSKIINPGTGRTVMLAIDHGYFMGATTGLEKPWEAIKDIVQYADVVMLTRGVLRNCVPQELDKPIVLRVSGGTSIIGKEMLHEGNAVGIEDVIRLNCAGMAYSILVGTDYERDTILGLSKYADYSERYGIPLLAVTAVGKELGKDARYLGLASRIAAEHGAHIVKTYYCEDKFEEVVEGCPVPIVIAGGKKIPEKDALTMAYNAIKKGAVGVDMGRNIFQSEDPVAMIQAVRAVVHDNATPDEAYEIFQKKRSGCRAR